MLSEGPRALVEANQDLPIAQPGSLFSCTIVHLRHWYYLYIEARSDISVLSRPISVSNFATSCGAAEAELPAGLQRIAGVLCLFSLSPATCVSWIFSDSRTHDCRHEELHTVNAPSCHLCSGTWKWKESRSCRIVTVTDWYVYSRALSNGANGARGLQACNYNTCNADCATHTPTERTGVKYKPTDCPIKSRPGEIQYYQVKKVA